MANTIRIKRSTSTNTPGALEQGELAYSEPGSPNSIGELFIGIAGPGVEKIGGNDALFDGDFSSNGIMRRTGAGAYTTDLTLDAITFIDGGNHKIFFTNGSGTIVELTHGGSGTVLQSNGATSAPTWETTGAGDVTKVGTPVDNQIGVWTGDGTLEGEADFIYVDGATTGDQLTLTGGSSLTSGSAFKVIADLSALDAGHLVDFIVDNVGATSAVLRLQQDGSGDILQTFDGGTEAFTVNSIGKIDRYGGAATTTNRAVMISDGTDLELRILVEADLPDLSGTYGDVFKVSTPVNNEIGVWTGDGTIEGEALFVHDSAATTGDQLSLTANAAITSGDVFTIISDDTGHTGNVLNLIQDEATTATAAVLRIQQDFTGDMLIMFNGGTEAFTINDEGKIDRYGGVATTTNRGLLISDGTDLEYRILEAADIPDLSATYGDVSGSGGVVDNTIVRWSGTGGDTIQESSITISDSGENMAGVGTLNTHTIPGGTSTFLISSDIGSSVQGYDVDTMFLDQAQTMTALLTLSGDPTAALHAVTKQYADALVQGLNVKDAVRVATTVGLDSVGNGTWVQSGSGAGATLTAGATGTTTIDVIVLADGDRVLVKNQADDTGAEEDGIYVVSDAAGGSATILTRTVDADTTAELESAYCFVDVGTANADTSWLQTATITTVDTTAMVWSQFSSAGLHTISNVGSGEGVWKQKTGNDEEFRSLTVVTNGAIVLGDNANDISFAFDLSDLVTDSTSTGTVDFVAYYDAGEGATNKILIDDLLDGGTF